MSFFLSIYLHHLATISPQAIFSPAFPEGWVEKSSGEECIITVFPIISFTVKREVTNVRKAYPFAPNKGGISPA